MKVFIAGPRAIKQLDRNVLKKLNSMSEKECEILIGDASGVDSLTQQYFKSIHYKNVEIYASNGKARNNLNNWNVIDVPVENGVTGFNFYVQKDIQMAKDTDYGFMIWNGESKGTFNNIINLLEQNKKVLLYLFNKEKF